MPRNVDPQNTRNPQLSPSSIRLDFQSRKHTRQLSAAECTGKLMGKLLQLPGKQSPAVVPSLGELQQSQILRRMKRQVLSTK